MKANEYKAWYRRNDPGTTQPGLEEYSRPYGERYERPPEYSFGSDAYPQYPEMVDISEKQEAFEKGEDKKAQESQSRGTEEAKKSVKKNLGNNAARGVVQTVLGNAVALVVGGAVLVGGYTAIVNEEAAEPIVEPAAVVTYVENWAWEDDFESATLTLTTEDGTFVAEIPATVGDPVIVPATCTAEGSTTYTASASHEDKDYSASHVETIKMIAHTWDDGTEDGDSVVYECTHCHTKVTVKTPKIVEN